MMNLSLSFSGPQACVSIAHISIDLLAKELIACAQRNGALSEAQLTAVINSFQERKAEDYADMYAQQYELCQRLWEAAQWQKARRSPFDRIIVKRFSHLFPARTGDDGQGATGNVSRRIIPGFIAAITKMIGPQLYEQCHKKCLAVLDRHQDESTTLPDWQAAYTDPDIRQLTNDILMVVSHYFSHFSKRRDWFMMIVNSNLAPAAETDDDRNWQLTAPVFKEIMLALFEELRTSLNTDSTRMRQAYGDDAVENLGEFLKRLERD